MYYNVCPDCSAHLDPGEECDCKKEQMKRQQILQEQKDKIVIEKNGQLRLAM